MNSNLSEKALILQSSLLQKTSFNKRAIKVYERLGFKTFRTCEGEISNEKFEIYQMRRKVI
ncbi:hypothetical protein [Senegalia massiliensis]|uniref:hypothetical protein n=1 Tax=Senegalia massiliensis TaxID=1720316 RepID=UPI00103085F9|nr:hypothetical protein [Senegalia massiliensis]